MNTKEILLQAMTLKPADRLMIIDGLLRSLDEPDPKIDELWAEVAVKRLKSYREGWLEAIPKDEVLPNS